MEKNKNESPFSIFPLHLTLFYYERLRHISYVRIGQGKLGYVRID